MYNNLSVKIVRQFIIKKSLIGIIMDIDMEFKKYSHHGIIKIILCFKLYISYLANCIPLLILTQVSTLCLPV